MNYVDFLSDQQLIHQLTAWTSGGFLIRKFPVLVLFVFSIFSLIGCEGEQGPAGPPGNSFTNDPPQAYLDADGIAGGATYSKWWTTDAGGNGTQPTTTVSGDFYRCKACHAWDGLGNAGSYASRTGQSTGKATRPDVSGVNLRSAVDSEGYEELYALVRHLGARDIDAADNSHPDFSSMLSDDQAWNLVKFMREEWVAPNLLYDLEVSGPAMYWDYSQTPAVVVAPTLTYTNIGSQGNEADGQALVAARCAGCHGADGTTLDIGGRSLGQFFREKPNEAWFKAKFGESGTGMAPGLVSSTADLQNLYAALVNATNFPDRP